MNSICIATYNGEKYIHEQLSSILSQINIDDEVIISDDNSTDNTIQIINSINDPRIKLINGGFHNFTFNFENAIKQAKGEYIFLADQDDVWLPNKYKTTLNALKTYDLVCSNAIITDQNLNHIHPSFFQYYNSGSGKLKNIIKCTYCGACMAFNKKILHAIQPFPNTSIFGHDLWIGLVAESIGKVLFLETPLIRYRRHDNSLTTISNNFLTRSKRPLAIKLKSRISIIYHLIKFNIKHYLCKNL
jgi:glycosyltransferase involved in cell wall biosynthesis